MISKQLDEEFRRTRLCAGDVLISVQGTVGKVALVTEGLANANISRTLARIRLIDVRWAPWIRYVLLSPQMQQMIGDEIGGTTRDSLNIGDLRKIRVPLPPLAEQRRIVMRIEALFARTRTARVNLLRAEHLASGYGKAVRGAAYSDAADHGQLGAHAERSTLVPLSEVVEGLRYGTAQKCGIEPKGIAVLRIPNVVGGRIDLSDLKYAELDAREESKLRLSKGDLLIIRSNGSPHLVGRPALVGGEAEGIAFAGYLIRARPRRDRVLPAYLLLMLQAPQIRTTSKSTLDPAAAYTT